MAAAAASIEPDGRSRVAALLEPEAPRAVAEAVIPPPHSLEQEVARLKNETRLLALEKKALSIRIAMLNGDREAITGSVPRPGAPVHESHAASEEPAAAPAGAGVPEGGAPLPHPSQGETPRSEIAPVRVRIVDLPPEPESADASELPETTGEEMAAIATGDAPPGPEPRPEADQDSPAYAIRIGTAETIPDARALWEKVAARSPEALKGLHARVAADAGAPDRLNVLAAGLETRDAAEARCMALVITGTACAPSDEVGERLP